MRYGFYKSTFLKLVKKCSNGHLIIKDKKQKYSFGNSLEKETAVIEVLNENFYKKAILHGDIGLGEAFTMKYWDSQSPLKVLLWFLQNSSSLPDLSNSVVNNSLINALNFVDKINERRNLKNDFAKAKQNISFHYDINNDFFQLMLDKTMAYSSGVYITKKDSLEQAQKNKYEMICRKLDLTKESSLLEIGSGWGGFAIYAAKKYKNRITTLTISKEQYEYVKKLIKREKLEKHISIEFKDYRLKKGKFDKIVSIEMIEAIGHKQVSTYLKKCDELLKPGGVILLQAITYPDHYYDAYVKKVNWIQKHIFVGSQLVSIHHVLSELKKNTKISLTDLETISGSYAKTLSAWRKNIVKNKAKLMELGFDDEFFRKWVFYLTYCEAGFATTYINDCQILLTKERENFQLAS